MVNRFKITERQGERIYPALPESEVLHVTARNGRDYTIRPTTYELKYGVEHPAWVFTPEDQITDKVVVEAYGLGENSPAVEPETHEIVAQGYPFILHWSPRTIPTPSRREVMRNPTLLAEMAHDRAEDLRNPLILASRAISATMDAYEYLEDADHEFIVKARSMGSLTGAMAARRDSRVSAFHIDGGAGVVLGNSLMNHAKRPKGMMVDEVVPAAKALAINGPEDMMADMKNHVLQDPSRLPREMGFLVIRRPDIVPSLEDLADRDTTVVLVAHELDQFFSEKDMDRAAKILVARSLLTLYHKSKGTRHVNGLVDPAHNAKLFHDTLVAAEEKKAKQLARKSLTYRRRSSGLLVSR